MGRLPESWMPPDHVLEIPARVRLYKALADERRGWMQRIRATLFHHGVPALACHLLDADGQAHLEQAELSSSGRQAVEVALRQIEHLEVELPRCTPSWWPSGATDGLPGPPGPLRDRRPAVGGHLGGARRLPALSLLVRRRAP